MWWLWSGTSSTAAGSASGDDCRERGWKQSCEGCEWEPPELLPENVEAWELWSYACTQWRMGGFGPVGLDFPAALRLARVLGIRVTPALLGKLRALERAVLKQAREKED